MKISSAHRHRATALIESRHNGAAAAYLAAVERIQPGNTTTQGGIARELARSNRIIGTTVVNLAAWDDGTVTIYVDDALDVEVEIDATETEQIGWELIALAYEARAHQAAAASPEGGEDRG